MKRMTRGAPAALLLPLALMLSAGSAMAQGRGAAPAPAAGAGLPAPTIMVIDTRKIMTESSVMKNVRQQVEQIRSGFQAEIKREEDDLRKIDQDLAQQRQLLSQEAQNQRRTDLQNRATALQNKTRTRRRQLDTALSNAMRVVEGKLVEITRTIAGERGANIVLPRTEIIVTDERLDATDDALRRMNQQLPAVRVDVPKE